METSKQAKFVKRGDWILWNDKFRRIIDASELITTLAVTFNDGSTAEIGIEQQVIVRTGDEHIKALQAEDRKAREAEAEDALPINGSEMEIFSDKNRVGMKVHELAIVNFDEEPWDSSQKDTENPKKGAAPFKDSVLSWVVALFVAFIVSGQCIRWADDAGWAPLVQLGVGIVTFVIFWVLSKGSVDGYLARARSQLDLRRENIDLHQAKIVVHEELVEALDELVVAREEVEELGKPTTENQLADFYKGMAAGGVEIALGDQDTLGRGATALLRFPVVKLHEQIVEAMLYAYKGAKGEAGAMATDLHVSQFKVTAEKVAWKWIKQMTEGKR